MTIPLDTLIRNAVLSLQSVAHQAEHKLLADVRAVYERGKADEREKVVEYLRDAADSHKRSMQVASGVNARSTLLDEGAWNALEHKQAQVAAGEHWK